MKDLLPLTVERLEVAFLHSWLWNLCSLSECYHLMTVSGSGEIKWPMDSYPQRELIVLSFFMIETIIRLQHFPYTTLGLLVSSEYNGNSFQSSSLLLLFRVTHTLVLLVLISVSSVSERFWFRIWFDCLLILVYRLKAVGTMEEILTNTKSSIM